MRVLANAVALAAGLVLASSGAAFSGAGERWGLLTPAQAQAYHECLYAAWVEDFAERIRRLLAPASLPMVGDVFR